MLSFINQNTIFLFFKVFAVKIVVWFSLNCLVSVADGGKFHFRSRHLIGRILNSLAPIGNRGEEDDIWKVSWLLRAKIRMEWNNLMIIIFFVQNRVKMNIKFKTWKNKVFLFVKWNIFVDLVCVNSICPD